MVVRVEDLQIHQSGLIQNLYVLSEVPQSDRQAIWKRQASDM